MSSSSSPAAPPAAAEFSIETLLGATLLVNVKTTPKPTTSLMKGKELIGLYFSASWCPPCKTFSPILASFYNAAAKSNNFEIVYISSDRTAESFMGYYEKMPWLSIPWEQGSAAVKNNLSQTLKVQGIPTLVVVDAQTGEIVSTAAREEVTLAGGDPAKAKAIIDHWKIAERKPLSEANAGSAGPENPILKFLMFIAKRPMFLIGIMYFYRWMQKKMKETPGAQHMVEDDPLPEGDSEF